MKEVYFQGSSLEDLKLMPSEVQDALGYALHLVQAGEFPPQAKWLKGFGGGVLELRDDFNTDTYRAVCVVRFADMTYVLHCFQKKSKSGIEIPRKDKFVIESRLKELKKAMQR